MSTTLRDATESTVHAITDRVGDVLQHIDMPHFDMPHFDMPHFDMPKFDLPHIGRGGAQRRRGGALLIGAVVALVLVVAFGVLRNRASADDVKPDTGDDAATVPSTARTPADAAA
ncbi:MAG: hypothetical protein Q7V88_03100 [Actinomycetota bacterium]|nr:hypothetical protein [Actinomycetota bacterium]